MKLLSTCLLALVALASAPFAFAQDTTGTLEVRVLPFTSEKELPKKVDKQLRNGGLEWGIKDDQVVFTMVAKQFLDFPVNHLTRYGQSETLSLAPGTYRITGVGLEMTTSFSVQKVLDKGGYFNENVMSFTVEAGKTTTLEISPVIRKDATFAVNFWMPTLMARVVTEGAGPEAIALNARTDSSVAWPQYHGPLKFVAK